MNEVKGNLMPLILIVAVFIGAIFLFIRNSTKNKRITQSRNVDVLPVNSEVEKVSETNREAISLDFSDPDSLLKELTPEEEKS